MMTATDKETLTPYERLQAHYGEGLDDFTTEVTVTSIALLSQAICGDNEPATLIKIGSFYSEMQRFPFLSDVVTDINLSYVERLSLLRYLAETL